MGGLRRAPSILAVLSLSLLALQLCECPVSAGPDLQASIELPADQANLTFREGIPHTQPGRGLAFRANASSPFFNLTYRWDFGDGSFSDEQSPLHTYQRPGTYNVTLTVSDGLSVTKSSILLRVVPGGAPPVATGGIPDAALWGLSALALVAVCFFLGGTEPGLALLCPLLVFLYSKLRPDRILDNYNRGQIHGYILANPGDHYNSIKSALKLKNGSLAYHLKRLEEEKVVKSRFDGMYKRFYPYDMKVPEPVASPLTEAQRMVLAKIGENPGLSQQDLAMQLNLDKGTINYHIERLERKGWVRRVRAGIRYRCYLTRPLPGENGQAG